MEITKRLYITAWITQIYIRLLTAWANKTVPPAMHRLIKFSINFLLHGLTQHLRVHHTDYRNCYVYTVRNTIVPFTQHGLTKVNFHLHRMKIEKLLHNTFRFPLSDCRNCSVYTARNVIVPFTPQGLTKVNFHLHRMEITKLLHITFRFHCTEYRNCSVYTTLNVIVPFTPHGIQKLLCLHHTECNCAIYTT